MIELVYYTCSVCGRKETESTIDWLALRVSADKRGVEVRAFGNSGPGDEYFCGEACAFKRVPEVLYGLQRRPPRRAP